MQSVPYRKWDENKRKKLLELFQKNLGTMIPHNQLVDHINVDNRAVIQRLVSQLRKKGYLLETVQGDGYTYWGKEEEEHDIVDQSRI